MSKATGEAGSEFTEWGLVINGLAKKLDTMLTLPPAVKKLRCAFGTFAIQRIEKLEASCCLCLACSC